MDPEPPARLQELELQMSTEAKETGTTDLFGGRGGCLYTKRSAILHEGARSQGLYSNIRLWAILTHYQELWLIIYDP